MNASGANRSVNIVSSLGDCVYIEVEQNDIAVPLVNAKSNTRFELRIRHFYFQVA